jgi:N-acetylmuramoyl-L-alanine amidase
MNAKRWLLLIGAVVTLACSTLAPVRAASDGDRLPQVTGLRFGIDKGRTRIVLDVDRKLAFTAAAEADPARLVIVLPPLLWNPQPSPLSSPRGLATGHRFEPLDGGQGRLIVLIREPFRIVSSELLRPSAASTRYRLLIEIAPEDTGGAALATLIPQPRPGSGFDVPAALAAPEDGAVTEASPSRLPVIVIDAGHGGRDPGAIGVNDVMEKSVTLAVARELRKALQATGRYQAYLTRDGDEMIALRDRIKRAREARGSLFISLHADAMGRHGTRGASVYTLSENASDDEAAKLAAKENKADIIAGADLGSHDPLVTSILIDLVQRDTQNKSIEFADVLAAELATVSPLLRKHRRFAGFAVLKGPDIPSVLVELGYLSNPTDAANLASRKHRARMAGAMVRAIDRYFESLRS